ncbi:MAG: Alpha-glucosidase, partial [Myxococcaceae bacterium]|nr:Alpha-glucosidase [Myxococcaceae bacterium]
MRGVLVFLSLCACGSSELKLQQFRLTPRVDGFRVVGPDAGVLLDSASLETRNVKARIESQYGSYRFTEGAGAWSAGTSFDWKGSKATVRDAAGVEVGTLEASAPSEGVFKLTATAARADANRTSLSFKCRPDDHFLGFGGQADAIDHRGHTVPIFTSEPGIGKSDSDEPPELWFLVGARHASSYGLPSFLSNRGFVAVLEHDGRSLFELCSVKADAFRIEAWGNRWTLWLYAGDTPAQALERATAGLLGRPMRPPPVAFAPWNDAIFGSANVRAVASSLRDAGVPSSVLWTEDFRGGTDVGGQGYRLKEEWTVDRTLYPDVEAVAADLRAQGFGWHAYFNTFLVDETAVFAEAKTLGHFVRDPTGAPALFSGVTFKPTGLVDLSSAAAREWMKGYLRQALELGFDGWMADYGEWLPPDAVLASGEDP